MRLQRSFQKKHVVIVIAIRVNIQDDIFGFYIMEILSTAQSVLRMKGGTDLKLKWGIDYRQKYKPGWIYLDYEYLPTAINCLGKSIVSPLYVHETLMNIQENNKELIFFSHFFYNCVTSSTEKYRKFQHELELEKIRKKCAPEKVSRLFGLFLFQSIEDAKLAETWSNGHFHPDFLVKIKYEESHTILDANWITHCMGQSRSSEWMFSYWAGEPFPGKTPIWEVITDKYLIFDDEQLKYRSIETIKAFLPKENYYVLERQRILNECGDGLSNVFYTGEVSRGSFLIMPSIIVVQKDNGKQSYRSDLFEPLSNITTPLLEYDEEKIVLPDFRSQSLMFVGGNSIMRSLKKLSMQE